MRAVDTNVLVRLLSRDDARQAASADLAALELFRSRPALGFADCLMVQIARKAGHLPPGTFDRNPGPVKGTQKL